MEMVSRHVADWARQVLSVSPVLVLEGARQVGKSTLATMLGDEDATFITMDDDLTRSFATDDPLGLLQSAGQGRLVIDEIQRCPELVLPLKAEVDRDRRPGRFVLTGSANLLRLPSAEDSLAGRAMTVRVHPFTQGELEGHHDDWVTSLLTARSRRGTVAERDGVIETLVRGGYPPVQDMSDRLRSAWLRDYVGRLLERDAADVATAQTPLLKRLLGLLAAAPGAELVMERLGEALGVNRGTAGRYLDVLEALFLIQRLPSWSRNLTGRQVQRPKVYLTDPGLAACLMGHTVEHLSSAAGADHLGPLLENFVCCELLRQRTWSDTEFTLYHYRDRNGAEVDLIAETPRGVIGIEVKATSAARTDHFRHLFTLRDRLGDEFVAGVVLTLVGEHRQVGDRMYAMPVSSLWS